MSSPQDWNKRYQVGDTPWDKGGAAPALDEILKKEYFPASGEVLVPGCGYGHDVRKIAAASYRVTGLDIAELAVAGARAATDNELAEYVQGDLFDPALASQKKYAGVWEHTCFCAIEPEQRDAYVDAIYNLLEDGGVLIGVFYINGKKDEGPPFATSLAELHRLLTRRFSLEWECEPERFFTGREGAEWLMGWRRE